MKSNWLVVLGTCGLSVLAACSSDGTSSVSTPTAGAPSGGAPPASAGAATAGSGIAGSIAGAPSGGAAAGSGGAAAGASGAATAGGAGLSGAGTGGAGGGSAGAAGAGGGSVAGAGGGASTCVGAGHALSLSGNTTVGTDPAKQNVDVDLGSDLPIGNAARTLETWAYMRSQDWAGNVNTLFYYGTADNRNAPAFGFDFGSTSGGVGTIDPFTNGLFDNDNQSSGVMVSTSQWVHFAMVYDPSASPPVVLAYVNGELKSTKSSTDNGHPGLATLTSHLTIGGYPAPDNNFFASYIDEFQVWKIARSAADIKATMKKTLTGAETGLVGYWQFNEASGTTAADSVTSAGHTPHAGKLVGTPVPTFVVPATPTPVTCP